MLFRVPGPWSANATHGRTHGFCCGIEDVAGAARKGIRLIRHGVPQTFVGVGVYKGLVQAAADL